MKRMKTCLLWVAAFTPGVVCAQTPADTALGWHHAANGHFSLAQAYFDNWTQGGSDALNWDLHLDGDILLNQSNYSWESKAKGEYGETQLSGLAARKSSDELDLVTLYTQKLNDWVNPFASAGFQSQFAPGYVYNDSAGTRTRTSGSFDPTYVTQTLGAGYDWQKELQLRLGGTLKETYSAARYGYADDKSTLSTIETSKVEPGLSAEGAYKHAVMENILLATDLNVFVNFKGVDQIYGRWENEITAKVNKYISADFGYDMLYDKTLSLSRQIKESLAVSVSFLSI